MVSPAFNGSTPIRPRLASAHHLVHTFSELPLFWHYANATPWRGALIDGQFEVSYNSPTDYLISDIWLSVDNGKTGADAKGTLINLKPEDDGRLYILVLDAIDHKYASYIEERIADEMVESGISVAA